MIASYTRLVNGSLFGNELFVKGPLDRGSKTLHRNFDASQLVNDAARLLRIHNRFACLADASA